MAKKKILDYKSPKWDKELKEYQKVLKSLGGESAMLNRLELEIKRKEGKILQWENPYAKVLKSLNGKDPSLYNEVQRSIKEKAEKIVTCDQLLMTYIYLQGKLKSAAQRIYLVNQEDQRCLDYTYLSGMAGIVAEMLDRQGANCAEKQYFEFALLTLIAVGAPLPDCARDSLFASVQLYYGNRETAVSLLEQEGPGYHKDILLAIIEKDEDEFNASLEESIKSYRKEPAGLGYTTFLDLVSIAFIKIAAAFGINSTVDVIEIPKMFLAAKYQVDMEKIKLPFFPEVTALLKERGIAFRHEK